MSTNVIGPRSELHTARTISTKFVDAAGPVPLLAHYQPLHFYHGGMERRA